MIGTRLGCWILERELGRGGMGAVYLARRDPPETDAPQRGAVKVLAAHMTFDPGALSRWHREIDVLRKLDHPNIVHLFDDGVEKGRHYYVMEYVDGPSLEAVLRDRGRLPWPEVLDIATQVCLALKHAHDRGVIHRDLKPSNLLVGHRPEEANERSGPIADSRQPMAVKLTDFGIAWVFAGEHLTATGGIVGTAEYLSPEQAAGKQPTKRSDIYSLGAVLYTLLTGRTPFQGETVDLLHKHRYGQFERPMRLVPELPHDLDEVVCEMLEKDPEKRPPDAGVLHRRLESLRRKFERKASQGTLAGTAAEDTAIDEEERTSQVGPATLMARLMRAELERQKYGGPVKRFFNRPVVIITLFLITVGLIVWTFWPSSPETLFRRGAELMQSEDPDDWETAWREYFEPLQEKYPDHPYKEEVAEFRKKLDAVQTLRQERVNARMTGPLGEAHWFYEKGRRLRQQGQHEEARAVWRNLIRAFGDVHAERPWVKRARGELNGTAGAKRTPDQRWAAVRDALARAQKLEEEGKADQAKAVRDALRELYEDDPSALPILGAGE